MYEENNSQDKPVVIGIDHGFSLMKTKHHIFSVLNSEGLGNNKLVDDIAGKKAKTVLQEMYGKDFSDYGFQNARIKAEAQLQNIDKDRSYERGVRIR